MSSMKADPILFQGVGQAATFKLIAVVPRSGVLMEGGKLSVNKTTTGSDGSNKIAVTCTNLRTSQAVITALSSHGDEWAAGTAKALATVAAQRAVMGGDVLELAFTITGSPTAITAEAISGYLYVR